MDFSDLLKQLTQGGAGGYMDNPQNFQNPYAATNAQMLQGVGQAPEMAPQGMPGGANIPSALGPARGGMVNGHPTLGTQPLGSEGDPSSGLAGMAPTFDAQGNMHIQTARDPRTMTNGNQAPSFLQQLLHGSGGGQSAGGAGHAGLLQSLLAGASGSLPGAQPQAATGQAGMPPWLLQLLMQMHQGQPGQAAPGVGGQILPQMPQQNG